MSDYIVFRTSPYSVEFCGTVKASSREEAEDVARLMFSCFGEEQLDLEEEENKPTKPGRH